MPYFMTQEEMGGWRMPNNHERSPRPNNGLHSDCLSYAPSSHGGYAAGVGTLRASGGDIGGGSEVLIVQHILAESSGDTNAQTCHLVYE